MFLQASCIAEMKTQALQWQARAGSFFNLPISALEFFLDCCDLGSLVAVNDKCRQAEFNVLWSVWCLRCSSSARTAEETSLFLWKPGSSGHQTLDTLPNKLFLNKSKFVSPED